MLKALLIDDNEEFNKKVKKYIENAASVASFLRFSRVDTAASCAEALRLAGSGVEYDLIVYDLELPWNADDKPLRSSGMRLIEEVRRLQPSSCGILASDFLKSEEAMTIGKLGVVGRLVAKTAGPKALLLNAQDAFLEAAQTSFRRLNASYHLQARIHETMNSLNNILAAVSEIERVCTPAGEFVAARSLPLVREEAQNIRRFQQAAEKSLREVDRDEPARREACDLAEIADWCAGYLRSLHPERAAGIELDVQGPIPVTTGVRDELRQMILVLGTNALQATEEGGRVAIRLRREAAGEGEVCLTVEDDGRGISEEIRPHIFDVGFSTRPGGTGRGLFLARAFAWNHGGRIEVTSRPGGGTRMSVRLPVRGTGVDE